MYITHIILPYLYMPGTAATNRILAYALGFASQGINVSLVLGNQDTVEAPLLGYEDKIRLFMVQAPHGYKLNKAMANKAKTLYKVGSTAILIYGTPALSWFLPKTKYNTFYECTEVPFYGKEKKLTSWMKERIKVYLAKRTMGMLVISKALVSYFKRQGIKSITVINMFVDSNRFKNVKSNSEEKNIAYCGTISPFKDGVDCLIKAFAIFHKSYPEYRLKIIGRFESKEAEATLRTLVEEIAIADVIDFTGMVLPEEMPCLLKDATMLALARPNNRQAQYGFPTKLGEYLATGNPVIVTNVGEIGDFLIDGRNCLMAEPDNPEGFAEKLCWVAEHHEEAERIGREGFQLTKNEFSSLEQSRKALEFMDKTINDER